MLKHEQADPSTVSPTIPLPVPNAADARVTPDELNAALKALEDQQNSTVAIGSVVDELRLNATPEEIWEQVQKQREQKQQAPKAAVFAATSAPARRRLRNWREIKGWVWILFWCTGGLGLLTLSPQIHNTAPVVTNSSQTITINGDLESQPINVQGKDVVINGDIDRITLHGQARSVTVNGDFDTLSGDAQQNIVLNGDFDHIR